MRKILTIAQREYAETVKTKTFVLSVLFAPLLIIGIIALSAKVAMRQEGPRPPVRIAVSDLTGELGGEIEARIEAHNKENPTRQILVELSEDAGGEDAQAKGTAALRAGTIDAYVVAEEGLVRGEGQVRLYTHQPKASILDAFRSVEYILRDVVAQRRCRVHDISPALLTEIRRVPIERVEVGARAGEQRTQDVAQTITRMLVPFFFMFMIYMGIVGIGQQMLNSVIEEKNSRIIEVLLSAVSPLELMAGKILGLAGIGFTIVAIWTAGAVGAARWRGLEIGLDGGLLLYFIVYYVLGFLLYSSLLAGVGSVCNTLKETQGLMMPFIMILIVPFLTWQQIVQSPDGTLSRVLSFIPPVTPQVMILRIAAGSTMGAVEIAATIALLAAAVLVMIRLAGRIFRTGILMYGKRPSLREVFQWMRQS